MKKHFLYFLMVGGAMLHADNVSGQATENVPDGYRLVWTDDFNGSALDENAWTIEVSGSGGGNQELQYYRRENVAVDNGQLVLTARREDFGGKSFTSGRINSKNKTAFKHGIIQARLKMPQTSNGLWPAYWMMGNDMDRNGWPRCGEIDIVEMGHWSAITGAYAGMQDRYFAGTTHWGPDASQESHQQMSEDFLAPEGNAVTNGDYHIFTIEWDDTYLYMYYDLEGWTNAKKRKARYFTQVIGYDDAVLTPGHYFQKPFFLLFNLAVGGTYTNIYDPAQVSALPHAGDEAQMFVDWVRVYQKDSDEASLYLYADPQTGERMTNIQEESEPEKEPDEKTPLSSFASSALDENGETTFDFDDAQDVILISTSEGVTGHFLARGTVLKNYNVDNVKNMLYIWSDTYYATERSGANSFGWEEGYTTYKVTAPATWSGLGFASTAGNGKDLSMIDDSYWLHFSMKATDQDVHSSHTMTIGDAKFVIGNSTGDFVSIGDFKRDGEWYSFDIPVRALRDIANPLFGSSASAYTDNVVAFLSGGVTDAELTYDNIFFYKSKSRKTPVFTDEAADLGKYGYKSLDADGRPVFDYSQCADVVPFALTEDLWKEWTGDGNYPDGSIVSQDRDYTMQGGRSNFFVWGSPQTFKSREEAPTVPNSTGIYTGNVMSYASVAATSWNGMGYASIDGMGFNPQPKDLSVIDDSYYLHLSLRSDAAVGHVPVSLRLGSKDYDAKITFGNFSQSPLIGDFVRNGEWYSFDIPVAVLKQYGQLWGEAGTDGNGPLDAYTGYNLAFCTSPSFYSGSYFSFDNVFFWRKADGTLPEVSELGDYTTPSLDGQGRSYFSFDDKQFIPVIVGSRERQAMGEENIVADFAIDDQQTHFYSWEGTYEARQPSGTNSFGNNEPWTYLVATDKGWTGAGIINDKGYDVSMLDENWRLHFAVKGDEPTASDLHLSLGKAHFTIGHSGYVNGSGEIYPQLGDFRRDDNWYSFDIPMSEFYAIRTSLFREGTSAPSCFLDNLFVFSNGGTEGDELQVDNIFFWREKPAEETTVPTGLTRQGSEGPAQPVAIYDLSGRRINAMSTKALPRGIYVVKTADKTRKVSVR